MAEREGRHVYYEIVGTTTFLVARRNGKEQTPVRPRIAKQLPQWPRSEVIEDVKAVGGGQEEDKDEFVWWEPKG